MSRKETVPVLPMSAEELEPRRYFDGSISGRVRAMDPSSSQLQLDSFPGSRPIIYVDLNGDGERQAGEPSDRVDSSGAYEIDNVSPGRWLVNIIANWDLFTRTSDGKKSVEVEDYDTTHAYFFLMCRPAVIEFRAFSDANGNGVQDSGEGPLAGVRFLQDEDADGAADSLRDMPARVTRDNGRVSYIPQHFVAHRIIARGPTGYFGTTASVLKFTPTPARTQRLSVGFQLDNRDAVIRVTVFNDRDADEAMSLSESGIPDIKIKLINSRTNETNIQSANSLGKIRFDGLAFGEYSVELVEPLPTMDGVFQKSVSIRPGENRPIKLAIQSQPVIRGVAFRDSNGNRIRDKGERALRDAYIIAVTDDNHFGFGTYLWNWDTPKTRTDAQGRYEIVLPRLADRTETMYLGVFGTDAAYKFRSFGVDSTRGDRSGFDLPMSPDKLNGTIAVWHYIDTNENGLRDANEEFDEAAFDGTATTVSFTRTSEPGFNASMFWEAAVITDVKPGVWNAVVYPATSYLELISVEEAVLHEVVIIPGESRRVEIGYRVRG